MLGDWLSGSAYHRMRFVSAPVDNPDQRIQQDITSYTSDSQSLALGAVSSCVSLVSFTIILWQLSASLTVFGLQIPRAMVFLAYIYVIIATVFAVRIGRPLIRLNFLNELLTASYRYALVRIRDNSENIAFYRGEQVENAGLITRFAAVIANTWADRVPEPEIPRIQPGDQPDRCGVPATSSRLRDSSASRSLSAMSPKPPPRSDRFEGALSFFRLAYDDFASYRASLNRLTQLLDADDEARALPTPVIEDRESGLGIRDLDVRLPDGRPLLTDLDLDLASGESLLVKGPSGSGKTTLLRSLAGLWPYVDGSICAGLWLSRPCSAAAAVSAAGHLAYRAGLPISCRDSQRRPGYRDIACRPARALGRSAGYGDRLVEDPLARRAAAAGVRPHPALAAVIGILRRNHLRARRGHGARDL